MAPHLEPCLSLVNRGESLSFHINFDDVDVPIDWIKLRQTPSFQQVTMSNLNLRNAGHHQHFLKLALTIKSHPGITEISFKSCWIDDLGPICVAIADKHELATIEFDKLVELGERAGVAIRLLLESNAIKTLLFGGCKFAYGVRQHITEGIRQSESLQKLDPSWYVQTSGSVSDTSLPVWETMISKNLVELRLFSDESTNYWNLFRALEEQTAPLKTLGIRDSTISVQSMEALMMMCLTIETLTKLEFCNCILDPCGLAFLARTLSTTNAIDALSLDSTVTPSWQVDETPVSVNLGNLKVSHLIIKDTPFDEEAFSDMMLSIADNPYIQYLDLSNGTCDDDNFASLCDNLLRRNKGPRELVVDIYDDDSATMLAEVLQVNTNLMSLSIGIVADENFQPFAEGLANVRGLRKLAFSHRGVSEEFCQVLQQCLEHNTSLWTVSFDNGVVHFGEFDAEKYFSRICYLLAINRVGRHQLMRLPVLTTGLWARVLARASNEPDGLYFALTEKPDIVTPSRKRKSREERDVEELI